MDPVEGNQEVDVLLAGIPQSANRLGSPSAPVALEFFGDLQCPFSRKFALQVLPAIIQRWVRAGDLGISYCALQTATREPEVFLSQQVAALAAGRQDYAWHFIETFYREQGRENSGYVTDAYLQGIASQIPGLSLSEWSSDRSEQELAREIAADEQVAERAGLNGTPSFLIGRGSSAMTVFSPSDPTSFATAIEGLLVP